MSLVKRVVKAFLKRNPGFFARFRRRRADSLHTQSQNHTVKCSSTTTRLYNVAPVEEETVKPQDIIASETHQEHADPEACLTSKDSTYSDKLAAALRKNAELEDALAVASLKTQKKLPQFWGN